jgi:hypothetical protein
MIKQMKLEVRKEISLDSFPSPKELWEKIFKVTEIITPAAKGNKLNKIVVTAA